MHLWLSLHGAAGRLSDSEHVMSFAFERIVVTHPSKKRKLVKIAADGEVARLQMPLEFRVSPQAAASAQTRAGGGRSESLMTLLLQISDTHFGTERPQVVAALLRLVDVLPPDLVVLSGDITQRARKRQFAAARAFIDTFGATPTLVVPGNHDIPLFDPLARLFYPYANHQRAFGADLEPSNRSICSCSA